MKIFRHYRDVPDASKGAVVAIGNFDGVHLGHQALIGEARELAHERGAPLGVLAFEPHPQEFFRPSPESFRLTPFRAKARLIAELGDRHSLRARLRCARWRQRAPQDFVIDVLVEGARRQRDRRRRGFPVRQGPRRQRRAAHRIWARRKVSASAVFKPGRGRRARQDFLDPDPRCAEAGQAATRRRACSDIIGASRRASSMATSAAAPSAFRPPT